MSFKGILRIDEAEKLISTSTLISLSTFRQLQSGNNIPSSETIQRLCTSEIFQFNFSYLTSFTAVMSSLGKKVENIFEFLNRLNKMRTTLSNDQVLLECLNLFQFDLNENNHSYYADDKLVAQLIIQNRIPQRLIKILTQCQDESDKVSIQDNTQKTSLLDKNSHEECIFVNKFLPLDKPITSKHSQISSLIYKHFRSKDMLSELMASNVKTLHFRKEWQPIVNQLVSETQSVLRAMVFDVELGRWWDTKAGLYYILTHIKLIKKKVKIKRVFILTSFNMSLRREVIQTACVHQALGCDVRICETPGLQDLLPVKADMFSAHDETFVGLYYFSQGEDLTNILCDYVYISEFISFYEDFFNDDTLCRPVDYYLQRMSPDKDFMASVNAQVNQLKRLSGAPLTALITNELEDYYEKHTV